jgi:outer membrane protein TolC
MAHCHAKVLIVVTPFAAGYGNIIELTDAQTLLTDSQVQEIVSRFDYQTAAAQLDVAVGRTPMP